MSSYWVYTDDGTLVIKDAPSHLSRKEIAHYAWSNKTYYTGATFDIKDGVLQFHGLINELRIIHNRDSFMEYDSLFVNTHFKKENVKKYMDELDIPENKYEIVLSPSIWCKLGIKQYCAKVKSRYFVQPKYYKTITTSNFRIIKED